MGSTLPALSRLHKSYVSVSLLGLGLIGSEGGA